MKTLTATLLAVSALSFTPAHAKEINPAQILLCKRMAVMVGEIVSARDTGVPLTKIMNIVETGIKDKEVQDFARDGAYKVYAQPELGREPLEALANHDCMQLPDTHW